MPVPVQPLARAFLMVDGTGSPQTSPIADGTSEAVIVVPAVSAGVVPFRMHVHAPSANVTLRKVSGGASGGTFTIPAGSVFTIPCKAGDTVYIGRPVTTTLEFLFEVYGS